MNDTQKMLVNIINNLSSFKQEILSKFEKLDEKLSSKIDSLDIKIENVELRLTKRINKIGKQLAFLEDDTPTRNEFDDLEKRVKKVERKFTTV